MLMTKGSDITTPHGPLASIETLKETCPLEAEMEKNGDGCKNLLIIFVVFEELVARNLLDCVTFNALAELSLQGRRFDRI